MELVPDIFLLGSLTSKQYKKCVMNIINILDIILKKCRKWELKHDCKDPNDSFFLFCALILRWLSMELVHDILFFGFIDVESVENDGHKYS